MAIQTARTSVSHRVLDAIHFKVRQDNRVINKAAYTVLAVTISGHKDILGIWIGTAESASFWLGVCNDLKIVVLKIS